MFVLRKISLFGSMAAALLVVLTAIVPAHPAFAQTAPVRPPLNLMTSPLPLNVVTKPGQPVTADIRVKNNGSQPEFLKIELLKFGATGDTGRPQLMERDPQDKYFDWVKFAEPTFTADPNIWKTVKMTINPPKEAAFGYYYAVLFSRANPDRPTGGASGVEGGVASLVLLNVDAPGARRETKVVELIATQKVYEFLPAKFTVKLRNTGNVHVSPIGSMFIKRGGAQVGNLGFNQERGNILPGTNRVFEVEWNDGFPNYVQKGTGAKATKELQWDFGKIQKLRFGRYTATLVAVYDDGQRDIPVEAEVSFWVIPWRILAVILLIVLLVGGGIWLILRVVWRSVKRQVVRVPKQPGGKAAATYDDLEPETPDESSLAAALRRKKDKKKGDKHRNAPEPQPAPAPVSDKKSKRDRKKEKQRAKQAAVADASAAMEQALAEPPRQPQTQQQPQEPQKPQKPQQHHDQPRPQPQQQSQQEYVPQQTSAASQPPPAGPQAAAGAPKKKHKPKYRGKHNKHRRGNR